MPIVYRARAPQRDLAGWVLAAVIGIAAFFGLALFILSMRP